MSKQYHYLVAGLPDLIFDGGKAGLDLSEFRKFLAENLNSADYALIQLLFLPIDQINLLKLIVNQEAEINESGNYDKEILLSLLQASKTGSTDSLTSDIPTYLVQFLETLNQSTEDENIIQQELHLTNLFYEYAGQLKNTFVRDWFLFENDITNLLTALNGRKYNVEFQNQLVGTSETTESLKTSNAKDFGLSGEFPYQDPVMKIFELTDLLEKEKRLDRLKWDFLENATCFHYFDIERVLAFTIQLKMINRWSKMDPEYGKKLFGELIKNMEGKYAFPDEFTSKK